MPTSGESGGANSSRRGVIRGLQVNLCRADKPEVGRLPLIVTLVSPRAVGKLPVQVAEAPARFVPWIEIHSPGWIAVDELCTGTMPPEVIDGGLRPGF
jgi:hypothetical protein